MGDSEKIDRILNILEYELIAERNTNNLQAETIRKLEEQNQMLLNIINNKFNQ